MPLSELAILDRYDSSATGWEWLPALAPYASTSSGTIGYQSPPESPPSDPLVVREALACVEDALGGSTQYEGTRLEWDPGWRFDASGTASLVTFAVAEWPAVLTTMSVHLIPPIRPHLEAIAWIKEVTELSQERIGRLLGVSRQTLNLWDRGKPIADENRRRVFAVKDVLELASLRHQGPQQLLAWLDTPRGSEGRTPAQLLERGEVGRARAFALSSPAPGLLRTAAWVARSLPQALREGAERRASAEPPDRDHEFADLAGEEWNQGEDVETLVDE